MKALLSRGAKPDAVAEVRPSFRPVAQLLSRLSLLAVATMTSAQGGVTPLWCAAQHGRVAVARALVACGADVSGGVLLPPLHAALQRGDNAMVALLLSAGASANVVDRTHGCSTPLHVAALVGDVDLVHQLVAARGDPNVANKVRPPPAHPLCIFAATTVTVCALTIVWCCCWSYPHIQLGVLPLGIAAAAGDFDLCRALIRGVRVRRAPPPPPPGPTQALV